VSAIKQQAKRAAQSRTAFSILRLFTLFAFKVSPVLPLNYQAQNNQLEKMRAAFYPLF
jgi:hypothetical protein